jgi:hypothetical protein
MIRKEFLAFTLSKHCSETDGIPSGRAASKCRGHEKDNTSREGTMSEVHWPRIKEILDSILKEWSDEHNRSPKMKAAHQGPIGWATKEELAGSKPYDKQLVESDKVGNGKGNETNLVRILRGPIGPYGRMPSGGPYASAQQIREIIEWIDTGMPD